MRSLFAKYLRHFSETEQCPLSYQDGSCQATLSFAGLDVQVGLVEESSMLLVMVAVGLLPDQGREEFYAGLLALNNRFSGTMGLTLGLDRDLEVVTLQGLQDFRHLEQEQFDTLLSNVAVIAARMFERLAGWNAPQEPGQDEVSGHFDSDMLRV